MEAIKITNERINQVLPKEIIETDVLTANAKKVLAVIINYHFVHEKAKTTGFLAISNNTLREASEINMDAMMSAINELIECNLITRERGQAWKKGQKNTASTYTVSWNNLKKEIKKPSFDELFKSFSDNLKSSETPIGTTTTNTSSDINSNTISPANTKTVTISDIIPDIKPKTTSNSKPDTDVVFNNEIENNTGINYKVIEKEINNDKDKEKLWEYQIKEMLKNNARRVAKEHNISIE